ncbi:MAG: alanine/glycine:cation symporter family protein [Pseudomonadota bacterium]
MFFHQLVFGRSTAKPTSDRRKNGSFLAVLFPLLMVLQAGSASAQTATGPCPQIGFSDRVNATLSPVTTAISNVVFAQIPIVAAKPTAEASVTVPPTVLDDRKSITLSMGGQSVTYEIDTDGTYCGDHHVISSIAEMSAADQIATRLESDFGASGLIVERIGLSKLHLIAPTSSGASLTSDGIAIGNFKDGSVGIPFIVIWLLGGAIFFTFYMGFINFRGFKQAIRVASGRYDNPNDPGEVTHFQALTAALSGTVGLGNIAGVAVAISIGGPGATFWMIMAGLFGMASKFTECTLGIKYRKINKEGVVSGGPMYYLTAGLAERGMAGFGKFLAVVFAVLCIGGAFGAGNMFQVNQSGQQFMSVIIPLTGGESSIFFGRPWVYGLAFAFLTGLVIIGGIRQITKVTERLVPLMAFVYLSAAFVVLGTYFADIPKAFAIILGSAFNFEAGIGAIIGVLVQGLRRATFSNEAGVGSAAIAHSAAKTREPVSEGMVALLEPFVDTVVICTITALVIIVTGFYQTQSMDGIMLTSDAFKSVIGWFPYALAVAVLMFAFSTTITWFYYGQRSFLFLFGDNRAADISYKATYLVVLVIGASMNLSAIMDFADAMLLAMAFPNMIGLYIMAPEVKRMLKSYKERIRSGEIVETNPRGGAKAERA